MEQKHIELIRGVLIEKMPQSPAHASAVEILRERIERGLPDGYFLRQEKPLTFADSEPEPDLAVIRGSRLDFIDRHPEMAEIVIEIALTSEALDRVKLELYANANVKECWLVLLRHRLVERYYGPGSRGYGSVQRNDWPDGMTSAAIPGFTLGFEGLDRLKC